MACPAADGWPEQQWQQLQKTVRNETRRWTRCFFEGKTTRNSWHHFELSLIVEPWPRSPFDSNGQIFVWDGNSNCAGSAFGFIFTTFSILVTDNACFLCSRIGERVAWWPQISQRTHQLSKSVTSDSAKFTEIASCVLEKWFCPLNWRPRKISQGLPNGFPAQVNTVYRYGSFICGFKCH